MDNVTVTVLQNGEAFDQIDVDRNGKYFLDVPLRSDYMIEFSAPDMVTKRVQIDGAAVPLSELSDGFTFDLDMSLFAYVEGFDESLLDTPIGIATFNERSARIEFDLSHTNDMRRKVANELDRVANLEEDLARARMRYDNAMEDGERAEARGRWEDAYDEYEKALSFIPGDDAANAGLARAEAALNADAEAEAAAQAEEQAAAQAAEQAEADARAAEAAAAWEAEAASRAAEEEAARAADAAARAEDAAARAEESRRQADADREAQEAEEARAQARAEDAAAQEASQQEVAAVPLWQFVPDVLYLEPPRSQSAEDSHNFFHFKRFFCGSVVIRTAFSMRVHGRHCFELPRAEITLMLELFLRCQRFFLICFLPVELALTILPFTKIETGQCLTHFC